MSVLFLRVGRLPLTLLALWVICATALPWLFGRYRPFSLNSSLACRPPGATAFPGLTTPTCDAPLATIYRQPLEGLLLDATLRSLALLVGAALLALTVGTLLGAAAAVLRRRAFASGMILGVAAALAAIPSFFVALLLQLAVIFAGQSAGGRLLPVFGFGYDEHLVLPLLAVSIPAVTATAQLVAARLAELLESDFVTTAHAKGLSPTWILRVHLLPHLTGLLLESLGSGLRVSVASLPIVEYLFVWNGIGFIALRAVAATDAAALTGAALTLAGLFTLLSVAADAGADRRVGAT